MHTNIQDSKHPFPIYIGTQGDRQTERSPRLPVGHGNLPTGQGSLDSLT
jgi:hypothetical protein